MGKPDEALNELNKGLEKSPGNILGLYQLGLTQRDLGRLDDAVASLESAIKNDPRHVDSMIALGELYLKKDNFSMATMHLRTALSIAPKSVRAHNALGNMRKCQRCRMTASDAEAGARPRQVRLEGVHALFDRLDLVPQRPDVGDRKP
jgi:cytochrome c-type biogenesis protein CcmH/NrfG